MKTTFKLRVLTPMFMGGAEPQKEPELRAASIRGAMRFWFRAMAGAVTSDPQEVYKLESEIFGNTERKSRVVVRVKNVLNEEKCKKMILERQDALKEGNLQPIPKKHQFLVYLANMGLVKYYSKRDLERENSKNPPGFYWDRGAFLPNFEFLIELSGTNTLALNIIVSVLKIAIHLGGFGTRWRHGFGSCEIVEINGNSPNKFDFSPIEEVIEKIKTMAESLKIAPEKEFNNLPDFPLFAIPYYQIWEGQRPDEKKWDSLLSYIGKTYREFRKHDGDNFGRYGHTRDFLDIIQPIFEKRDVKSDNPRNDVFGLPIQFSKQYGKKRKTAIINVKEKEINRRASPLILHVEPDIGLIRATLFKSKFLPEKANYIADQQPSLKLRKPNENDFQRIEKFLQNYLGLTRRYPNA
ncbi:MAG: type III-B CRISPR module RAMP protein Cmr1 [Desulfonauticus sp.]|nr:type III-B CRISPR module RAMP protein Cmr1 [Desulfonauticus sp.]